MDMRDQQPPRLFQELSEGGLDDDSLATLEEWFVASGLETPPEEAVARARRISRQRRPPGPESPLRRLVARLIFDTRAQPLPAGVRTSAPRARRMLFTTDGYDVVVQIVPEKSPTHVKIFGQILAGGTPVSGAAVRVGRVDNVLELVTDPDGEFRLAELPKGLYWMEVTAADELIELSTLGLADD